ncbi:MAG TPA: M20 family metallopeptidase [Nitrospinota bacterium]|nr:M20 family metallopeptidase [Nitrospinota bacterium]|tara:strand:+ start:12240 stop:13430 length:1191 start_codon:yes stop_codon:yes gene_type:complete
MKKDLKNAKTKLAKEIDNLSDEMREIANSIFDNPETCYTENFAASLLTSKLKERGFAVESPYLGLSTAFIAKNAKIIKSKPIIAILAEYDALPGIGHACGHNLIAASAFGAAVALKNVLHPELGNVVTIGTPAEEGGGGKIKMIRRGAFSDIDAAIMIHPSNKTRIISRMYAITELKFTFIGKAAHAAAFPEQGINALDAGVLCYNSISSLRQQIRGNSRVHGIFTYGGDAPNIIPDRIEMHYFVRDLDKKHSEELLKRIKQCAKGAAKATGCKVKIKTCGNSYDPFYPSYPMGEAFADNLAILGIADGGFSETTEIGSSDIGNLSQVVPTLHPEYAVGDKEDINHSRNFLAAVKTQSGHKAMLEMTKAMAMTVYDLLTNHALLKRTKDNFNQSTH